ncbi:phosphomevalonate kinase [Arctopsyche grandis]|uniref:phosphomevalonate kinase n=1 Tax=Arctopsyche grandis TaxID=121162 RepID=UPI00406D74B2
MSPQLVLLFSGKRKSGKDYITDQLYSKLNNNVCTIVKISQPIKSHWAKTRNLDLNELLSDGEYKERYRLEMIKWSEDMRDKDYGCFCRLACENAKSANIWIVSDIRRKTDLLWFRKTYGSKVKTVKVFADDETRKGRGWTFTPGVDDAPSECNLDDVTDWDYIIDNNDTSAKADEKLRAILDLVQTYLT